jgi:hypothetical protein
MKPTPRDKAKQRALRWVDDIAPAKPLHIKAGEEPTLGWRINWLVQPHIVERVASTKDRHLCAPAYAPDDVLRDMFKDNRISVSKQWDAGPCSPLFATEADAWRHMRALLQDHYADRLADIDLQLRRLAGYDVGKR